MQPFKSEALRPGEGDVRIALVDTEHRLRQAARGVKKMMSGWGDEGGTRSGHKPLLNSAVID